MAHLGHHAEQHVEGERGSCTGSGEAEPEGGLCLPLSFSDGCLSGLEVCVLLGLPGFGLGRVFGVHFTADIRAEVLESVFGSLQATGNGLVPTAEAIEADAIPLETTVGSLCSLVSTTCP